VPTFSKKFGWDNQKFGLDSLTKNFGCHAWHVPKVWLKATKLSNQTSFVEHQPNVL
jgi:hypothetical protein